jgi:hypothetical protein
MLLKNKTEVQEKKMRKVQAISAERIVPGLFGAKPKPIIAVCGAQNCGRIKTNKGWTRWTTGAGVAPDELCPECAELPEITHH